MFLDILLEICPFIILFFLGSVGYGIIMLIKEYEDIKK